MLWCSGRGPDNAASLRETWPNASGWFYKVAQKVPQQSFDTSNTAAPADGLHDATIEEEDEHRYQTHVSGAPKLAQCV